MNKKDLEKIGAALYVCEGTKLRRDFRTKNGYIYAIELTNSDAKVISCFAKFLKNIINPDWARIRGQLFTYPDLDENKLKKYWSDASGIPLSQFQKSIFLKAKIGKFKPSPYGTFKIRYSSKEHYYKLQAIIEKMWRSVNIN